MPLSELAPADEGCAYQADERTTPSPTSSGCAEAASLARRASTLFARTGPPKLVLVTCENYNPATGHYASNVVVTLTPVA